MAKKDSPTIEPWRHVTRQQLAALMGVHPDTVTDYARADMPVVTRGGRGKESQYDAVACLDWQRQQLGKNAKEAAQTRAYDAQAKLNELKLERESGRVVIREQVVLEGQAYTKAWAARVRGLPRRMVQSGLLKPDQEIAAGVICRDILNEISSWKTVKDIGEKAKPS